MAKDDDRMTTPDPKARVSKRARDASQTTEVPMHTASLVKVHPHRKQSEYVQLGRAALYRLSSPVAWGDGQTAGYVFVSTSTIDGRAETYAFPANEAGACLSWVELPGSMPLCESHERVLAEMGYTLERCPVEGCNEPKPADGIVCGECYGPQHAARPDHA